MLGRIPFEQKIITPNSRDETVRKVAGTLSTTSNTPDSVESWVTPELPAGTYELIYIFEYNVTSTSRRGAIQVEVNGTQIASYVKEMKDPNNFEPIVVYDPELVLASNGPCKITTFLSRNGVGEDSVNIRNLKYMVRRTKI